mmetsp:Transcript_7454/g.15434  ORF Transcript_7454/g.15434 Transcript_7454/m.15434 type:complete len:555 (-) Transcript_7454:370-2034(-)
MLEYDLIVSVERACAEFDHCDVAAHDAEIAGGASEALFLQLERLLLRPEAASDISLELVLSALEMVHRCSKKCIKQSVKAVGKERALTLPCRLLQKYRRHPDQGPTSPIVGLVLRLLTHFGRVICVRQKMSEHYDLLASLVHIVASECEDAVRMPAIELLAEFAYCKGCVLVHVGGLLDALAQSCLSADTDVRQESARVFLNLSAAAAHRQLLGWKNNVLHAILSCLQKNSTVLRQYAIAALGNISACAENKLRLAKYEQGFLVQVLLFTATATAGEKHLQQDALAVLANLTTAHTAYLLCTYPEFFNVLVLHAANDREGTTQAGALAVLRRLSSFVGAGLPQYHGFLDALLRALAGKNAFTHVAAMLREQSSVPANRQALLYFPGLLNSLGLVSLETEAARRDAIEALRHLSDLDDGSTFLASDIIFTALATAAALPEEKDHLLCVAAMTTIGTLAVREENRATLQRNCALFHSLLSILQQKASVEESLTGSLDGSILEYIFPQDVSEVTSGDHHPDMRKRKETPPIRKKDIAILAGATLLAISGIDAHRYYV